MVRRCWHKACIDQELCEIFVKLVIGLLYPIAAACYFCELSREWTWQIGWECGDELVTIGHLASELIMEEGSGEIEISYL